MSYKDIFIEKTRKVYKLDVLESRAIDTMEETITNYFIGLQRILQNEIDVSGGEFSINIYPGEEIHIVLDQRELKFTLECDPVPITLSFIDFSSCEEREKVLDELVLNKSDMKFYSSFTKKELDDDFLNWILQVAFDEELNRLMDNPAY